MKTATIEFHGPGAFWQPCLTVEVDGRHAGWLTRGVPFLGWWWIAPYASCHVWAGYRLARAIELARDVSRGFMQRRISRVSLEHREFAPHWAVRFAGKVTIYGTGDTPAEAFADAWLGLELIPNPQLKGTES